MEPIFVLEHDDLCPTGWLGELIAEAGIPTHSVAIHRDQPVPGDGSWSAIVSLGGEMGAYEEQRYPVLKEEKRLLAEATAAGTPVLGLCLGAQILAEALGGEAHRGPSLEWGYPPIFLTTAGQRDPVLRHLAGPVLEWHRDTFRLPEEAVLLAYSDRYPQAFRLGRSLGVQFHAETSPEILAEWVADASEQQLAEYGIDEAGLMAEAREKAAAARATARALFGSWIEGLTLAATC